MFRGSTKLPDIESGLFCRSKNVLLSGAWFAALGKGALGCAGGSEAFLLQPTADLATEMNEIGGPGEKIFNGDGTELTIQKISGDGAVTLNRFKDIVIIQKTGKGELHVNDCKSVSIAKLEGSGAVYLACSSAQFIDSKSGEGDIYFRGQRPMIASMGGTGHVISLK